MGSEEEKGGGLYRRVLRHAAADQRHVSLQTKLSMNNRDTATIQQGEEPRGSVSREEGCIERTVSSNAALKFFSSSILLPPLWSILDRSTV